MARLVFEGFDGMFPRLARRMLPDRAAVLAQNCRFRAGHVEPIRGPGSSVATVSDGAQSLYRWERGGSSQWLGFATPVSIARAPVHEDQFDRIYYSTAAGAFRLKGWKSGAETDRLVGLAAPAAAPGVTVAALLTPDAFRALPNTAAAVTVQVSSLADLTGEGWDSGVAGKALSGLSVLRADVDGDTVRLRFAIPAVEFSPAYFDGNLQHTNFRADSLPTTVTVNNATVVGSEPVGSVPITSGSTTLATLHFTRRFVSGLNVSTRTHYRFRNEFGVPQQTIVHVDTSAHELVLEFRLEWGGAASYDRDVYYVQTHTDDLGQESPPSALAGPVHVPAGYVVTIGAASGVPSGGNRLIYRSGTGTGPEHDNFYFAHEGTAAWQDVKPDAELAEQMPLIEAPPAVMYGLTDVGGGVLAGFKGREVFLSEPWLPFSWPTEYRLTMRDEVVGIAHAGSEVYVLLRSDVSMLTGVHPEHYQVHDMQLEQGCASALAVAVYGGNVFYASPDGIVALSGGQGRLISEGHFSRREWQALVPSSILMAVQDGVIYMRHTGGGLAFSLTDGMMDAVSTFTQGFSAAFRDGVADALFIVDGEAVRAWGAGSALTLVWQSREWHFPRELDWSSFRIEAAGYPVTLKLYRDNALVLTRSVANAIGGRLPRLDRGRLWSVRIEAAHEVRYVGVATEMRDLRM